MVKFSNYSVLVTENCNLACKYCYEVTSSGHKNKKMNEKTAEDAVYFMFEQVKDDEDVKEITVSFFGGEPTLMPSIIDIMCSKGKELSKEYNKHFYASMITNATNMNKKLYDVLKKHNDIWQSTQLSIDGPYDIQDEYRVTKANKGSFHLIQKNMPYWKELYGDRLNIHGVINPNSVGRLYESFLFFREEWNVPKLWFLPSKADWTDEHIELYERELEKIYNYVLEKVKLNNNTEEVSNYAPLDRALRDGAMGKPCGAGESYCTITSDGGIWPCHHFYFIDHKEELKLGSIYSDVDQNKKRLWDEYDVSDLIGCEECSHPACYRCIAENYEKYKNPFVQIKGKHCAFMLLDHKYQQKLRKELEKMGLINKKSESDKSATKCLGLIRDCVGKSGDCDVVVSVDECVFDREDCTNFSSKNIKDFEAVCETQETTCEKKEDTCCCKPDGNALKNMLDEVIGVLVKYHNKL